jgi:hypothetical protein
VQPVDASAANPVIALSIAHPSLASYLAPLRRCHLSTNDPARVPTELTHRIYGLGVAFGLFALWSASVAAAAETPTVLPKMTVGAGVPLVKVAEFQMLEPRLAPAAVEHRGFIYIIGGLVSAGTATDSIERFDPRTGKSEIIGHLKVARLWHRAVVVGEKIYVLGGATPGGLVRGSLNPAQGNARAGLSSPSVGPLELSASVEIFDLATGTIARGPEMLGPRNQFACVFSGGRIFAIGGQREYRDKVTYTNTVEVLDVATSQWQEGPPMPTLRATEGAFVDGGFIVVAGGYNGTFATDVVETFDLRAATWRTIAPLCRSTSANSIVFYGSHLFLFGDFDSPERLLAYNLKNKQSEVFTLRYTPARHTAAVVADDKIFVIGGRAWSGSDSLRLIQVFAPTQSSARPLTPPPAR